MHAGLIFIYKKSVPSVKLIFYDVFGFGRVAEEVIFGDENVTTGASNDFMQVSRVARQMVERFGFSKKIGQVAVGGGGGNPFLGQQVYKQTRRSAFSHLV